jgi:hypothetical protein
MARPKGVVMEELLPGPWIGKSLVPILKFLPSAEKTAVALAEISPISFSFNVY